VYKPVITPLAVLLEYNEDVIAMWKQQIIDMVMLFLLYSCPSVLVAEN
jgi:hypothetical protein